MSTSDGVGRDPRQTPKTSSVPDSDPYAVPAPLGSIQSQVPSPRGVWPSQRDSALPTARPVGAARFCPACGGGLVATAIVCPSCGSALGSPRSKGVAVLLAIFLSFWTWVYTYKRDSTKFWVAVGLTVVGIILDFVIIGIFVHLGVWLWAVISSVSRDESRFQQYPNADR